MKIICNTEKLKYVLDSAERIITRHLTLPILGNFLLKTDKTGLKVVSTNLEIGITAWFPCKVVENGEVTVPAKIFHSVISGLGSDKVELSLKKNNTLRILAEGYEADLKGENAKDFPIIPKLKQDLVFEIEASSFCGALNQVVSLVSNSETRPEITGVFVSRSADLKSLAVVGTDSFRLGEKNINLETCGSDNVFSVIIPARTAAEVIRIFGGQDGKIKIILEKNQISFESDKVELVSRLIEGNFPDYKKLIPQEFNTEVKIHKEDLLKKLKLVSLFSSRVNDISLSFMGGKEAQVKIFASDPDLGENTSAVPMVMTGENPQVKFNWKYLVDGVSSISASEVKLSFIDDIKPCLIRADQDKDFLYLVMPIRA